MNILLTGATGFIGSHIARAFIQGGHSVRASIRSDSSLDRIADIHDQLQRQVCDVFAASEGELEKLCEGVELCVHAAWYAVPGKYLAAPENLGCVTGSLRLLEALAGAGTRRAVFIGSCFEYDFEPGYLSETSPVKPQSLYAAAKVATRYVGEQLAAQKEIEFAWPRFFYQYGPFEDPRRLVPYVIETLMRGEPVKLTKGTQVRDFLHVEDVASAVVAIAESQLQGVVNVGSGQPVTVRRIVETIESLLERQGLALYGERPENPTDPPFIGANNRKLVEGTGWNPTFDLTSGLRHTIEWSKKRAVTK